MFKTISMTQLRAFALVALSICAGAIALPAAAEDCVVKLGNIGPTTGGGASWGLSEKAGVAFEVAWVNSHGGLQVGDKKCTVAVVTFDTLQTAAGGAAAGNFLAAQDVHATIGPIPSPETTGFKPVGKRFGIVNFSSSFSVDAITPEYPLAFSKITNPLAWGAIMAKAARERFHINSIVVVGPNDQGGTDAGKAESQIYREAGLTSTEEWYQRGTTNFAPMVQRLMNLHTDAIEMGPMPVGESAILIKQLLEAGYKGVFGRMGSGASEAFAAAGGVEHIKASYSIELTPTEDAGIKRMNADYEALMKTKEPENSLFYCAQIAAEQLLRAISVAGTDKDADKIAEALRKTKPVSRYLGQGGWRGKKQYGINQQMAFAVGMGVVENGKWMPEVRLNIPSEE